MEGAWLGELAAMLAADPAVLGARLLGSSARGEAAGLWWQGRWQRLSDLELLVVTRRRRSAAWQHTLKSRLQGLIAGWRQESPLFHLDLLFRERRRLRSMPPFVFTFEAREAGRTLCGPELGSAIRPVTLGQLDRRNTREILVKRLWHLAEVLPRDLAPHQDDGALASVGLRIAVERQALDLPTALLPDAGRLLAGFGSRVASWEADPPAATTRIEAWLGRPLVPYLRDCLAGRAAPAGPRAPWTEAYAPALAALAGGLDHLRVWTAGAETGAGRGSPSAGPDPKNLLPQLPAALALLAEAMPGLGPRCFNEGPVTPGEGLALWRQAVRIADSRGPSEAWRWLRSPRKGLLAAGLLQLHAAGLALASGDPVAAGPALRAAGTYLAAVHADGPGEGTVLSARQGLGDAAQMLAAWRSARRQAGRAFWRVARLGSPSAWTDIAERLR